MLLLADVAVPVLYPLSLHDALPICTLKVAVTDRDAFMVTVQVSPETPSQPLQPPKVDPRSEEHTSELQSPAQLVCRLLPEKKMPPSAEVTVPVPVPPLLTCRVNRGE